MTVYVLNMMQIKNKNNETSPIRSILLRSSDNVSNCLKDILLTVPERFRTRLVGTDKNSHDSLTFFVEKILILYKKATKSPP